MTRKVLVFGEYGVLNGGENSFLAIIQLLQHKGWEFVAAVPAETPFETALTDNGISNRGFHLHDAAGERKTQPEIRAQIGELLDDVQPNVIHCNSLSTGRLVGPVAQAKEVKSVGYLRDILKLSKKAIADINCLDHLVAVSQATRDWHTSQGMAPEKIVVIYNGVDSSIFRPELECDYLNKELDLNQDDNVLLFVGQIGMRKGIQELLQIHRRVSCQLQQTKLLIVGQRNSSKQEAIEYEETLIAESQQTPGLVHWLGRRNDVASLMNRAQLLIHPAKQEPLGRVLLEAAACGLPILATSVGGTPEILADCTGYQVCFPVGEVEQFGIRAVELLKSPTQRQAISQKLQETAKSRFSIEKCAEELHQLYLLEKP